MFEYEDYALTDNDCFVDKKKEYAPKDYAPKDYAPKDYAPKDYAPKDYAPKDYAPKDYAPKEFEPKDYGCKECFPKKWECKKYEPKEYEPKEYEPKEYEPKEYEPKEYEPMGYDPKEYEPKEKDKKEKDFHCKKCEFIEGNSVDFKLKKDDCEIRADIQVKKVDCVRIWGRVKDCFNKPVEGALVKLVKAVYCKGRYEFIGVAHTVTDCKGFYQFNICEKEEHCEYRILVGGSASGKERVIDNRGCCHPCKCDD